jgi:hypothetical protein
MKQKTKRLVAVVALAGAVTAGGAGVAVAAEGGATPPGDAATEGVPHPRRAIRHAVGTTVADTLGVSRADLRAALVGGMSISEYAQSLGQDPQAVVDALVAAANDRIDRGVANERITATWGAELKSKVAERVNTAVNRHVGDRRAT